MCMHAMVKPSLCEQIGNKRDCYSRNVMAFALYSGSCNGKRNPFRDAVMPLVCILSYTRFELRTFNLSTYPFIYCQSFNVRKNLYVLVKGLKSDFWYMTF